MIRVVFGWAIVAVAAVVLLGMLAVFGVLLLLILGPVLFFIFA
ncbi:MAG: hypothetical protein M5T61_03215 [Acidimicrobiia bacterium]|nr:hypothetical protein [Acidimicrobiia bacterium]